MPATSKQQADAYDRLIDAAGDLADMIEDCGIRMDEYVLEELTIYLASNAPRIRELFKNLKYKVE